MRRDGYGHRLEAGIGAALLGSVLIGLGCAAAIIGVLFTSYALSPNPDTARWVLVTSALPLILLTVAFVAPGAAMLRSSAIGRWLTRRKHTSWTIAACSLAIGLSMIGVIASSWPDADGWVLPAAVAVTVSLATLGLRNALSSIAASLVLTGAFVGVASTLPQ
jgi:hypothetical protein